MADWLTYSEVRDYANNPKEQKSDRVNRNNYIDYDGINDALMLADYENDRILNRDAYQSWEPLSDEVRNGLDLSYFTPGERRVWDNADDVILGYDPREGSEGYVYEEDNIPLGAYFVPGVGNVLFAGKTAYDVANGRTPGALDLAFGGGAAVSAINGANRAGKSFMRGYNAAKARRLGDGRYIGYGSVEVPKYRLMDKDGNELLVNNDKFFDRRWK